MPVKYDVIKCPRDMGEAINDAINMAFDELRKEYIPIEWIHKWINERNDFPTMPYNQHIWDMLEDWEKSKDARRQG